MKKNMVLCVTVLTLSSGAYLSGCESGSGDSPGSHMIVLGGVSHLDGYTNPLANCTECHGTALRGGSGPDCYGCHDSGDHNTVRSRRRHRAGSENSCMTCHGPDNSGGLGPACSSCH
jgi:hypothetical protein